MRAQRVRALGAEGGRTRKRTEKKTREAGMARGIQGRGHLVRQVDMKHEAQLDFFQG
jgi:hypothetical protein